MDEKLVTVPESWLTNIADAIRLQRDMTDLIPVPDMPLQISLISGGAGKLCVDRVTTTKNTSSSASVTINHSLGEKPNFIMVMRSTAPTSNIQNAMCVWYDKSSPFWNTFSSFTGTGVIWYATGTSTISMSVSQVTGSTSFVSNVTNTSFILYSGKSGNNWYAGDYIVVTGKFELPN